MNDELASVAGRYEEFIRKLWKKYVITYLEVNEQVAEFKKEIEQLKDTRTRCSMSPRR